MKRIGRIFLLLVLTIFISSCSFPYVATRLDRLKTAYNYGFLYRERESKKVEFSYKNELYPFEEIFSEYIDGYENYYFCESYDIKESKLYCSICIITGSKKTDAKLLINYFDFETKETGSIYEANKSNILTNLGMSIYDWQSYSLTCVNGYHDSNNLDFVILLKEVYGSRYATKIEIIFDSETLKQIYNGDPLPETYNPEEETFKQTGAKIEHSIPENLFQETEKGTTCLKIDAEEYYFDGDWCIQNCEHYLYLKTHIYPKIDSVTRRIFMQDNCFYVYLQNFQYGLPYTGQEAITKGLVFKFNFEMRKLDYCGYIDENSILLGVYRQIDLNC